MNLEEVNKNLRRINGMYEYSIKWGNIYIKSKSKLSQKSVFETNRLYNALSHTIKDKSRILDVGCGKGFIANFFLNGNYEYYGFDINNTLVRYSAKNYGPYFFIGNGLQLPIKDNSVDAIIFNAVLHHILDIECILKESVRVLRPNGIIFIQEPNSYSFLQILTLGINAPLKFIYGNLDPNERPINPKYIQNHLMKLKLDTYCMGVNIFPFLCLRALPFFVSNFINKLDLIIISILLTLRFPLIIVAMNFCIIGKKN